MRFEPPPATLRLRIDRDALTANWQALDRFSGEAQTGAAVKADCYGLGVAQCVPALRDAGAAAFFVAHWGEVAAVAAHVSSATIGVLHGVSTSAEANFARDIGGVPVINTVRQAQLWQDAGGGLCHLMVDTGINRIGLAPADIGNAAIQALNVDTLMSHLACAEEDSAENMRQLRLFRSIIPAIAHRRTSISNSAGTALGEAFACDLTRPGLALYGGKPNAGFAQHIRQVAYPQAAVLQIRHIAAGERVGYNGQFVAPAPLTTATVSLGYADGFLRARGHDASLTYQGTPLPVIGKVSMDMITLDARAAPMLREGDWLDVPFDLPQIAESSGLSQYELLTTLGHRFDRA